MSTLITINVTNNSPAEQTFFFFQKPAIYVGGPTVYSNSLLSAIVEPYAKSGSIYEFELELQYYAGVQQQTPQLEVGKASGFASAIQAIELTPAQSGTETNCTTMSVNPALGLTPATNASGVELGAFRIVAPQFNPIATPFNGGSAVMANGSVVLSNFITVQPSQNLDCQPILTYYVATGSFTAGTVMNFSGSSETAALCDATQGLTTFNVSYNRDGSWTVAPASANTKRGAVKSVQQAPAPALNANILNEAGTGVICQGHAASFNAPIVISQLTTPAALHMHSEYQVGPVNGPYQGHMLTGLAPVANSATFN